MIRIAFRFDDPSPVSKHGVERGVLSEFSKRGLALTFAVIPARIREGRELFFSNESASHLLQGMQDGSCEIALHGFRHKKRSVNGKVIDSEFQGVPYSEQVTMIGQGLSELRQVFTGTISGFVPPWNSYDANTLKALQENGFSYVSAGGEKPPFTTFPVLPATCALSRVKHALKEAERFSALDPVIVVVLHHYDFQRDDDDPMRPQWSYDSLGQLLDWLKNYEGLRIKTLSELANDIKMSGVRWPTYSNLHGSLSWRLKRWVPQECFTTRKPTLKNVLSTLKKA